jgi:hypothetical protein
MEITQEIMDMLVRAAEEGLRIGKAGTEGDYTAQGIATSVAYGVGDGSAPGCEIKSSDCAGVAYVQIDPYQKALYNETVMVAMCSNCRDYLADSI